MSILDQISKALFYKEDSDDLDITKLAGLLGFGLTASGAIDYGARKPPVGYQGVVPKYNFVRSPVQGTYQDYRYMDGGKRRPGSGGQRYFTDPQFVQETDRMTGEALGTYADDLAAAEEVATTQAEDLQEFNRRNPAHDWEASGWGLTGGSDSGIATLPTIPTPDSQLAGAINLGMANGGIVGLKNGTRPYSGPDMLGPIDEDRQNQIDIENKGFSQRVIPPGTIKHMEDIDPGHVEKLREAHLDREKSERLGGNTSVDPYEGLTSTSTIPHTNLDGVTVNSDRTSTNNDMDKFLNKDSWDWEALKNLVPDISEGIAGLKDKVVGLPGELKDLGKGVYEDVTNWRDAFNPGLSNPPGLNIDTAKKAEDYVRKHGGNPTYKNEYGVDVPYTGHGNILNLGDWKNQFVEAGNPGAVGNQFVRNAIQDYNTAENLKDYNVDSEGKSLGTYSDAEKSRIRGERKAEEEAARMADWRGQDYANFSQEAAQDYLNKMAGTTRGSTGDYSDLDTFQDYRFSDPNFQYDDFRKIAEIAGYGAEDQLSAGKNISSGAGPDAYRQSTPDTTSSWVSESYPTSSAIFQDTGFSDITNITPEISNSYSQLATAFNDMDATAQNNVIDNYTKVVNGEATWPEESNMTMAQTQAQLNYFNSLRNRTKEEVAQHIAELKSFSDLAGVSGQQGLSGAAYGGAIEGYSIGGLGEAPDVPAGLLKSPEDGMADTIPAQMGNRPINLSGGEYIVDAESVAFLGNGNTDAGARKLDDFRENLRMAKNGGDDQGNQINSENFLNRLQQMGVA